MKQLLTWSILLGKYWEVLIFSHLPTNISSQNYHLLWLWINSEHNLIQHHINTKQQIWPWADYSVGIYVREFTSIETSAIIKRAWKNGDGSVIYFFAPNAHALFTIYLHLCLKHYTRHVLDPCLRPMRIYVMRITCIL